MYSWRSWMDGVGLIKDCLVYLLSYHDLLIMAIAAFNGLEVVRPKEQTVDTPYSMAKKILFLVPYPLHQSPSQRFRFEQYFNLLKNNGYSLTVQSFLDEIHWKLFFKSGNNLAKFKAIIYGLAKRTIALFKSPMYDFVFIHREAAPFGPPIFEWILAKGFKKKIIYDFDDAIWLTDRKNESWLLRIVKYRRKVSEICRWASESGLWK